MKILRLHLPLPPARRLRWKYSGYPLLSLLLLSCLLLPFHTHPIQASDAEDASVFLPVVGNRMCTGMVTPDLFGVQMYGATTRDSTYFVDLMDSRATWVRVPVSWRNIEPVNTDVANFRWSDADRALAGASDGCVNVIATHRWNPEWAADSEDGPVHTENLDDLADYLAALVERYDGDGIDDAPGSPVVRYWELYNEPDAVRDYGGWGSDPERYAEMLKVVRPRIWNASHEAKVVFGGMARDWFEDSLPHPGPFRRSFLRDVVEAGGPDIDRAFDVMNFHYFPDYASEWEEYGPGLVGKTNGILEEMDDLGLSSRPVMVTEAGHYANEGDWGSSEELHMRYVPVIYAQGKASPKVESVVWFSLYDVSRQHDSQKTGLVEVLSVQPYSRRRAAFLAYQVASQQLSSARYQRPLSDDEAGSAAVEGYRFSDPLRERVLYVAWRNPVRSDETAPVYLQAEEVTVYSVFGTSWTVKDADDGTADGRVRITVSGRPRYIEIK